MKFYYIMADTMPFSCKECNLCGKDVQGDNVCFGIGDIEMRKLPSDINRMSFRRSDCPLKVANARRIG